MSSNIYSISDSSISIGPQTTYFNLHIHTSKHFYLWSFNPYIYIRQKSKHMRIFQSLHLPKMWYGEHYRLSIVEQFQSTHSYKMWHQSKRRISIHTPAQNATYREACRNNVPCNFNPRIRAKCDFSFKYKTYNQSYFNPRIRAECNFSTSR